MDNQHPTRNTTIPSSLRLEPVTLDDIPEITKLWYAAMRDPFTLERISPDTPGVRQWWDDANRHDLLHKPFQHYVKVVDTAIPAVSINGHTVDSNNAIKEDDDHVVEGGREGTSTDQRMSYKMIAYAKWDLSMPGEGGDRFPPWHPDSDAEACEQLNEAFAKERKRVLGDERSYCKFFLSPLIYYFFPQNCLSSSTNTTLIPALYICTILSLFKEERRE
jgi:hypothetical protein